MARVLVVDDERSIRVTLSAFLTKAGHEVKTAEDAEEGLTAIERNPVDVIVSDIVMPRLSGVELLQAVRERTPDTLVIMMTGEPRVDTAAEALRAGAFDYLVKPVSREAIVKAVASAARLRDSEQERARLLEENRRYQHNLEQLIEERTGELQRTNDMLRRTMLGTIEAMTLAVECRDPYTAGHQQRVASLAQAVGQEMGLTETHLAGLHLAGTIHDLGKIKVPAEILSKPSKLTEAEFSIIQEHPRTGATILARIEFPWPIADIIDQHHERLDGSGYPQGLTGDAILPEARVLAVADVVEAMASHRPYRPSLGLERALAEIRGRKGRVYDPAVVEACIAVAPDQDL